MELNKDEIIRRLGTSEIELLTFLKDLADERIKDLYSCHEDNCETMLSVTKHVFEVLSATILYGGIDDAISVVVKMIKEKEAVRDELLSNNFKFPDRTDFLIDIAKKTLAYRQVLDALREERQKK